MQYCCRLKIRLEDFVFLCPKLQSSSDSNLYAIFATLRHRKTIVRVYVSLGMSADFRSILACH